MDNMENNTRKNTGAVRLYRGTVADQLDKDPYYGFHRTAAGWVYRTRVCGASQVFLLGDFNNWNRTGDPMLDLGNGNWVVYLCGKDAVWPECRIETVMIP